MIRTFKDKDAEALFAGRTPRRLPADLRVRALRKLRLIDAAPSLQTLAIPPSNRLEALAGDRAGQHSIRINDQWRICFVWRDGHAFDVAIVDYH